MLTQTARKTEAGRYMLELYAQWVVPDAAGRIRMPVGLEHAVEDLAIRAWLDTPKTSAWTIWHWSRKRLSQTAPELRRCTGIRRAPLLLGAAAQRWLLGAACTTRTCRF
ncbi:hypothetical protein XGA_4488 [Xanthomonas hortorum ATCC 19865]|nr:hypothetical protein XGA_4488 [Xanthomonas hortorum ATCC 19865]